MENDETVSAATTPLGKAFEAVIDTIMQTAASAGIGLNADDMTKLAAARDSAEAAGKSIAGLQGGLSAARSFDHDGDGAPGGSKAKAKKAKTA